jgi:hypothetical protein
VEEVFLGRPGAGDDSSVLNEADLDAEGRAFRQNLESWEWRFGKTPPFIHRVAGFFQGKPVEVALQVRDGRIEAVRPGTEEVNRAPGPGTEEARAAAFLAGKLTGVPYGKREIRSVLETTEVAEDESGTEEPIKWFLSLFKGW